MVHERRHVAEAVVNHVRLGREFGMRAVANELCDGETALAYVLVEDAIGKRTFGRDEMHVRLALETPAQMTQLGNLALRDSQLALRRQIGLAGVLDVQLVELRADVAPDARFLRGVFDDRRAQPFETMTPAQREELATPGNVTRIPETRMPRLELEFGRLHRRHHRAGVDWHAVLGQHRLFAHGCLALPRVIPGANSGP